MIFSFFSANWNRPWTELTNDEIPTRKMVVLPLTAAPELTVLEINASHGLYPISGAVQWKIIARLVKYITVCYLTYTLREAFLD
jgi:hypothetical protein